MGGPLYSAWGRFPLSLNMETCQTAIGRIGSNFPPKISVRHWHGGSADPLLPPLATALLWYTTWWVLMSDGRCRGLVGRFGLVCGPSLLVWRSVGYSVQLCCIFCLFLLYSGYGCLQSMNHQNSWKWLEISLITTFGVWKLWKDEGVDGFISDLSTVNNQPDYRICVNVSGEGHHFAILVYYPQTSLSLWLLDCLPSHKIASSFHVCISSP